RHDLAPRKHDAFDEDGRVRDRRHVIDHLDVQDLLAPNRVGRPGDAEQDVRLHRRCGLRGRDARLAHADTPVTTRACCRRARLKAATSRISTTRPSPNSVAPETPSTRINGSVIVFTTTSRQPAIRSTIRPMAVWPGPTTLAC